MARRKKPANPAADRIPAVLLRFDPADWPPTAAEPDALPGAERFFAHRRWKHAQRQWAEEHDMTVNDLWRAIWA